ncbi:MAG: UvrD-helicase domain-containing protein [Oscillospiraceae bacterium]|nr:UvrD-helicase domain-containing protein [Oscillospiraceae bacterium]
MIFTPEQQEAVNLRSRTVLVSAAAGAGKTRVLVERLMGYVTDPEQPRHIDEFLVVTYTRAAAGELRGRIFKRLRELLDAGPDNAHLRAQLTRIYTAKIGTLDATCREIILQNAAEVGLPSGYRTGDEAEIELLRARVLDETLDGLYERAHDDPDDLFTLCADTYGDERGDAALSGLILHIWQKTRCHADPMGWLKEKTEHFPGAEWQTILLSQALSIAETFRRDYPPLICGDTGERDLAELDHLLSVLRGGDWEAAVRCAEGYGFERLTGQNTEEFKQIRKRWKDAFTNKIKPLIFNDPGDGSLNPLLAGLYDAVKTFDEAYMAEKLRLGVLEFTDVQRLALGLLQDRPPARFCEILVDEVQDINPLQDAIITALSREGQNLFYVGDARQSIYRFQMAEPGIFQRKLELAENRIFLTKNFRSSPQILNAVNHVFSRIDCPEMGLLQPHEYLISGQPEQDSAPVELLIAGEDDVSEPERVARRLRVLIESGEAHPDECVILMRSPKSRLPEYKAALEREGLPCAVPSGEGYFEKPEIRAMLSALEAIGNARLDVPLLSVLRSPIASVSPDGLAILRTLSGGTIADCLALSEDPGLMVFRALFQTWRDIAADLPPYLLAARVMADADLPRKVSPAAAANLLQLPELLREYNGDLRDLSDWADTVRQRDAAPGVRFAGTGGIRILSIHASKGLEFPVVVVAGLSKKLNLQDQRARLLAHPRLGLGIKTEEPTPSYRAVQAVMDGETRAEELRLLYVAMTRAERRLVLSVGELPEGETAQTVTKGDLILHSSVAAWLLKARSPDWRIVQPEPEREMAPLSRETPEQQDMPTERDWVYPYAEAVDTPSKMTVTGLKGRFPDEQARENAADRSPSSSPLSAAERGTATHLFLQFADFQRCAQPGGAEAERSRLLSQELLTPEQAGAVDIEAVTSFFQTPRGNTLLTAEGLRREQKFSLLVQNGFLPGFHLPEGEKVLLQGVIDCFYHNGDGIVLLDFKTDRVKPGAEEHRAERYRTQMEAYAAALEAMFGKPVREKVLVFLSTGREVYV